MDGSGPEPHRHKRSFTDMSHSATLSPSPAGYIGPAAGSFFSPAPRFTPAPDNLERRRTSHPHNSYLQQRQSEDMSDRSQSQPRPRLEHRASQTIIDLTDEPEEPAPPRNVQPRHRRARPPHLDRSDAVNLGDLIDLTDDSLEQDVIVTGERQAPTRRARPGPGPRSMNARALRDQSPSLFLPLVPPAVNRGPFGGLAGLIPRGMGFHHLLGGFDEARADVGPGLGFRNMPQEIMDHLNAARGANGIQMMPQAMNYQLAAHLAEQKPEHVAPPPAKSGFTRSPKEDHILICPSCEEELIQNNEIKEPVVKKSGKNPTKKELEEHPFWVVKDCGHVYCNTCFQRRTATGKSGFVEIAKGPKKAKTFICAVEDCDSDVKGKDKWVGVFL